ncbi:MAG: insulinase family protein, partial [Actinobacteria bacterium]|nr:insulinase family protein [Actinomycetota bacterium]
SMDEVALEEVNAAIRKHLQTENIVFAFVTANADKLKDALASDAPSPIDYGNVTKPPEILAEDEVIQRYPLKIPAANIRIVPVEQMFAGAEAP